MAKLRSRFARLPLKAAWAALGLLASACWGNELVIGRTTSALALPIEVAAAQGYFAAEGVQVRLAECSSGPRCLQQVFDRTADLAGATELPVVFASFQRADYAIVTTMATSGSNIKLVARKSAGIAGPSTLQGKRVGYVHGTSAHYFLDAYLLIHGVDPRRLELVPLQADAIVAAFERRQIDAFSGFQRHVIPAVRAVGDDAATFGDARIYTESYGLVARRDLLKSRGADVVKVLRALLRAQRFIQEQPGKAMDILQKSSGLTRAEVERMFPDYSYRLGLEQSLVSTMEAEARWALREGHVRGGAVPNYLGFVDFGPMRAAMPESAR
jgi:ABC-type nitrate/sulfonate/bicarbonate transport system substrate-binding protein